MCTTLRFWRWDCPEVCSCRQVFRRICTALRFWRWDCPEVCNYRQVFRRICTTLGFWRCVFTKCVNVVKFFRECVKTCVFFFEKTQAICTLANPHWKRTGAQIFASPRRNENLGGPPGGDPTGPQKRPETPQNGPLLSRARRPVFFLAENLPRGVSELIYGAPRLGFGDGTVPKCVTVVKFFAEFAPHLGFGDAIFPKCVSVVKFFRECVKKVCFLKEYKRFVRW